MSTMTAPALTRGPRPVRPVRPQRPMRPVRPVHVAPAQRPAAGSASAPVRLTRRGRLVMAAAVLGAAFGILGAAQPQAFALGDRDAAVSERVTVRPGETLWAIAARTTPGVDPRDTIARIQSMNDLESSTVPAGSVLLVPARG